MPGQAPPLRKLAFGDRGARLLTSAEEVFHYLSTSEALREVTALRNLTRFKAAGLRFPGLKIFASSSDPFEITFAYRPEDVPLVVPISGAGRVSWERGEHAWSAHDHMIFGAPPGAQTYFFDTPRAVLFLMLDRARLGDTLRSKLGREPQAAELQRLERLTVGGITAGTASQRCLLLSTLALADQSAEDADHLRLIGYDDVIHRVVADLYASFLGSGESAAPSPRLKRSLRAVDVVCDHIIANSDRPLTLTDMERMTGMTSRSLHNAFQERFNTSPQEWQRNYRLDQARAEILQARGMPSVKSIARQFGFISPYSFSSFYKRRFGEPPSDTLRRARGAAAGGS